MVVAVPKQRMCLCALNLVDVVDGLTSARVMVRDLLPLKEVTQEQKKEAGQAALIFLKLAQGNLDASEGYCEMYFSPVRARLLEAVHKIEFGDFVTADSVLEGALPKLKEVLRECAHERE